MEYDGFYRYIYYRNGKYWIIKNGELFIDCLTLEEALYERDRLIAVGWNWDLYVELPHTNNNYIHINLPPFSHSPRFITRESEYWLVRGKGTRQKYYGIYKTEEEAKRVALIYDANINYKPTKFIVRKTMNGKEKFFGKYNTLEEAEKRVEELEQNGWKK